MKWKRFIVIVCAIMMIATLFAGCQDTENKQYIILEDNFGSEQYGIGFRSTDIAFGLEVQRIMDEMIADGTATQISEKWFGKDSVLKDEAYLEETTAPEGDDSLQKIKDKGYFILGLDDTFPPMGFLDEDNEIKGYDIDLAKEVAKRMGVELKIQPIDWDSKEMELNTGKIDCIWNGMSITEERLDAMYFTKPYINNKQIIIVAEDSGITKKADLKDKVVGLQKGSSALDAVRADPIKEDLKSISEYAQNVDVYNDLKAGRIDVMVVDEVVGRYIMEQDGASSSVLGLLEQLSGGVKYTLGLFAITVVIAIPLGLILSFIRNSKFAPVRGVLGGYIWVMRGTPLLLQLYFFYFGLTFIPGIGQYLVMDRFTAACVAFVLNYAAYFCEIFRGGLLSVDKGQYEAAKVLGFSNFQTATRIVVPQMLRVSLPSVANECITLVKDTSLITAIGVTEILYFTKGAVNRAANPFAYVVAAVFYLVFTLILTKLFHYLEKKMAY